MLNLYVPAARYHAVLAMGPPAPTAAQGSHSRFAGPCGGCVAGARTGRGHAVEVDLARVVLAARVLHHRRRALLHHARRVPHVPAHQPAARRRASRAHSTQSTRERGQSVASSLATLLGATHRARACHKCTHLSLLLAHTLTKIVASRQHKPVMASLCRWCAWAAHLFALSCRMWLASIRRPQSPGIHIH